jgi:hypothetical protein
VLAGTVTWAGAPMIAEFELPIETIAPPDGAAPVSLTVTTAGWPPMTLGGLMEIELNVAACGTTMSAADLTTPESDAVTVTGVDALTVDVVIWKVCEVVPCATMMVAGTVAAALELLSDTVTPPLPAADVRVTVPVPVPSGPSTIVDGLTETLLSATATGLTVRPTVAFTPK